MALGKQCREAPRTTLFKRGAGFDRALRCDPLALRRGPSLHSAVGDTARTVLHASTIPCQNKAREGAASS